VGVTTAMSSSGSSVSTKPVTNNAATNDVGDGPESKRIDAGQDGMPVQRNGRLRSIQTKPVKDDDTTKFDAGGVMDTIGKTEATSPVERYRKAIGRNQSNDTSMTTILSASSMSSRSTIPVMPGRDAFLAKDNHVADSTMAVTNDDLIKDDADFVNAVTDKGNATSSGERYSKISSTAHGKSHSPISTEPVKDDVAINNDTNSAKVVANKSEIVMSPMERYRKTVNRTNRGIRSARRLFPHTTPATPEKPPALPLASSAIPPDRTMTNSFDSPRSPLPRSPKLQNGNPFDSPPPNAKLGQRAEPFGYESSPDNPFDNLPTSNPFESFDDSPPRRKLHDEALDHFDDPFQELSSPIPMEQSMDPFEDQSSPISVERSSREIRMHHEVNNVSLEQSYSLEDSSSNEKCELSITAEENSAPPSVISSTASESSSQRGTGGPILSGPAPPPSSSQKLFLAPSKRDTLLHAGRTSPSLFKALSKKGPAKNFKKQNDLDEIRASITQLKHNGVGGVGKSTSTLVRNEATGRYVIRDVDDDHFDGIINADGDGNIHMMPSHHCPRVIDEEEEEESSDEEVEEEVEEADESRPRIGDSSFEDRGVSTADHLKETQTTMDTPSSTPSMTSQKDPNNPNTPRPAGRTKTQTPIMFMMANQIMSESVLDDDAVEDAVRAATECLSTASSTTCSSVEDAAYLDAAFPVGHQQQQRQQQQRVAVETQEQVTVETKEDDGFLIDEEEGEDDGDFFAIRRPSQHDQHGSGRGLWNEPKWSAFQSSSTGVVCDTDQDYFDIRPSKSMDEWGGGFDDDDDSFAPGPQWDDDSDDDSCWGHAEEKVNEKGVALPSPVSVVVSKMKLRTREG